MHRYPEGTIATPEDLLTSRLADAIASAGIDGYAGIWQALSKAAATAMEEARPAEAKALWLVADATSMMLKPKSVNEPFAPLTVLGDRRSAITSDFSSDDIAIFAAVAAEVENHYVRSRLCDLVWLCDTPRDANFARSAIDAYCAIPLTADTWGRDARDCWERAIALCLQLRAGAGQRLDEIETALLAIFDSANGTDGFFPLSVSRLIFDNNLGRNRARETADRLADRGNELVERGDYDEARGYLEAAALWYGRIAEKELLADMNCAVAETWAKEAEARASADRPSNVVAASFYENAIQTLRRVPRSLRATRAVDQRLTQLYALLDGAGKASLGEMGVVSSGPIDISEIVEAAQASVRGKDLADALLALCNVHCGARISKLKGAAEKMLREHPLQALLASTHLSRDGRVVAKRPSLGFGDADSQEYQAVLWAEMVKYYSMEIGLIVQGQLLPALDVLMLEHRVREADLEYMVRNSPIVPAGRASLIAKGLFAGLEHDLVSALHLLVPQVEHLVRWHLKSAGVKTSTLSREGIETENGLSTLVDLPEVVAIFGEDLAFEFKALFCDPFGPNLRNEVAHGLLDASNCQTAQTFYAWWLVLRMTFNTFWNAAHKPQAPGKADPVPPENDGTDDT
jgi:tetratricopeptide (TPR) repeat protein